MENMIGYTTAIGQVTRESGKVIGNSLKSIASRITSIPAAVKGMAEIGVSTTAADGSLRRVDEILPELAEKWKTLSTAQQQNLGISIAGRYQLSRFLVMMNNFDDAQASSSDATNSVGSAMAENETYLQSYEAKINMMKNAWTEFALAFEKSIGGSIITGGVVALKGLSNTMTTLTDTFGAVPTIVGVATFALLNFTKAGKMMSATMSGNVLNSLRMMRQEYKKVSNQAGVSANALQNFRTAASNVSSSGEKYIVTDKNSAQFQKVSSGVNSANGQTSLAPRGSYGSQKLSSSDVALNANKTAMAATNISSSITKASSATVLLKNGFNAAKVATIAFGTAVISSMLPLLAISAVVWGISKIAGAYKKNREEAEATKRAEKQLTQTYKDNEESIDKLIAKYDDLTNAKKSGFWSADQEKELVKVQNQLNKAMPSLTESIDAQGNAHLKNSKAIKEQITYLKDLRAVQALEKNEKAPDKFNDSLAKIKELEKAEKKRQISQDKEAVTYDYKSDTYKKNEPTKSDGQKSFEDGLYQQALNSRKKAIVADFAQQAKAYAKNYNEYMEENMRVDEKGVEIAQKAVTSRKDLLKLSGEDFAAANNVMLISLANLKKELGETDWNLVKDPLSDLAEKISDPRKLYEAGKKLNEGIAKIKRENMGQDGKISDTGMENVQKLYEEVGFTTGEAASQTNKFTEAIRRNDEEAKKAAESGLKDLSKTQQEYINKLKDGLDVDEITAQKSFGDIIAGVSTDEVDKTKEMVAVYNELIDKKDLSVQQNEALQMATSTLVDIYGVEESKLKDNIGQISNTVYAKGILVKASESLAKGELSASEISARRVLEDTMKKIEGYKLQIEAVKALTKILNDEASKQEERYGDGMTAMNGRIAAAQKNTDSAELDEIQKKMEDLQSTAASQAGSLETAMEDSSSATSDSTDEIKDHTTEVKSAIYVADTYANKLHKINEQMTRNNSLQSLMATYSRAYRANLAAENKLNTQKLELMKAQEKSMKQQIASGNINQTGVIDTSTSSTTYGSGNGGSTKANFGAGFTRTSGYGGRNNPTGSGNQHHNGVDYGADYGTKIKAQQGGKVTYAGYSSSLGNFVQVEIEKGVEVIYGHMSEILTKTGDKIAKNTTIGKVGSTGDSTGNHVHYAVKKDGKYVNPDTYQMSGGSSGSSKKYSGKYSSEINSAAKKYGVDPNLIAAIMKSESTFDKNAKSDAGAIGLMQLMPSTAAGLGVNPYSVQGNVDGGAKYISQMLKMFNGDMTKAIAAYNAGPGNVQKYGGIPPIGETQAYVPKVLKAYQDFGGSSGSSSGSNTTIDDGSTDEANRLQQVDTARNDLLSLQSEILATQVAIQQGKDNIAQSLVDEANRLVDIAQSKADLAEARAGLLNPTSSSYRKEIGNQEKYLGQVQKNQANQMKIIKAQIKSGNISDAKRGELQDQQRTLEMSQIATKANIQNAMMTKINSQVDEYQEAADKYERLIKQYKNFETLYPNNAKKKIESVKGVIKAYNDEAKVLKKQIDFINKSLKNDKLSSASKAELKKKIDDLKQSQDELNVSLTQEKMEYVNKFTDSYKAAIQQQMDLQAAQYDKEIKDLQKVNDKKSAQYDKDVKAYQKAINEKLRALDDASSTRSFENDMKDMKDVEAKLRQQINALSLDDSASGKARRKELQDQLDENLKSQDNKKYDRDKELQTNALNDASDKYSEDISDKQEADRIKLEEEIEKLEKQKEESNYKFTEILNDEAFWKKVTNEALKGTAGAAIKQANDYIASFGNVSNQTAKDLGVSFTALQSNSKELTESMKNLNAATNQVIGKVPDKSSQENVQMQADWATYLANLSELETAKGARKDELLSSNKKLQSNNGFASGNYNDLRYLDISKGKVGKTNVEKSKAFSTYVENQRKMEQESISQAAFKVLTSDNQAMRKKYGFPNKSYENLAQMKVYHSGGIVGQDANFVNNIAKGSLKPNEQIAKLLKGEVVLNNSGISNIMNSMRQLAVSTPLAGLAGKNQSNDGMSLVVNIDNINAQNAGEAKKQANQVVDQLVNALRNKGIR